MTKLVCYSRYLLTSYFCIPIPYDEKDIIFSFLVLVLESLIGLHRTGQLQILNINDWDIDLNLEFSIYSDVEWLPWKQTKIILLFLRFHPGTEFWTILLTMGATPFLLRDSCPQ